MCRRRGEDLKKDQLMRVALPRRLEQSFATSLLKSRNECLLERDFHFIQVFG